MARGSAHATPCRLSLWLCAERLESLKDHSAFDHSPFGQQPLPWGGEPITVCLSFLCSKGEKEV